MFIPVNFEQDSHTTTRSKRLGEQDFSIAQQIGQAFLLHEIANTRGLGITQLRGQLVNLIALIQKLAISTEQ
jgi:hypothetical protein